jgi:predicted ATPase
MAISPEVRRLGVKWDSGNGWPKRLEWLEISNIRNWTGQRIQFNFPIVAIVGENGSGKSTVLQSAACSYRHADNPKKTYFPSEFFPETAWDKLTNASITYGYWEGGQRFERAIRKPTTRWLGQPERPERRVTYLDLSRLQPVGTRVGYARIAKSRHQEESARDFSAEQVGRMSNIMGCIYDAAKMALSNIDSEREIPVLTKRGHLYSGYHQGGGETTIAELLMAELPKYGLVMIDEIESSLHPRAQRRLIRDLAMAARHAECQIIITTHSPFVLEELPVMSRVYILETDSQKEIANGVSPQFAMTKMDDENHPELEIYVEDVRSETFLREILSKHCSPYFLRCSITPYGAANLGLALGQMNHNNRFRRKTLVFLDGDQDDAVGCLLLPGDDAPERVVFNGLREVNWRHLWAKVNRDISSVTDACERAMTLENHHEWIMSAANSLMCGGDILWNAMCSEWADMTTTSVVGYIETALADIFS